MAKEKVGSVHSELTDMLGGFKIPEAPKPASSAPHKGNNLGKIKPNPLPPNAVKFNTREAVRKYLSKEKTEILYHKARKKVLCGAKNSGKSIVAIIWQILTMETDPMVSHVSARKHQGSAKKRLGEHYASTIVALKNMGFYFPYEYEVTQQYITKAAFKSSVRCQKIEFASFGNTDGLAGIQVGNGGYIAGIHYEEPSQMNDSGADLIDDNSWKKSTKNIRNSAGRLQKLYSQTNPKYPPFTMTEYVTFNDWDEDFKESKDLEAFMPRKKFLEWCFGGINPDMILGNKELLDKYWESIKTSLLTNHTKSEYIKYDERDGKKEFIDTLFVRMSAFANPSATRNEEWLEEIYADVYNAIVTNDAYELASALGMLDTDTADNLAYNLIEPITRQVALAEDQIEQATRLLEKNEKEKDFTLSATDISFINNVKVSPFDTYAWLNKEWKEKNRFIMSVGIGWDVDVTRRAVMTTALFTAIPYYNRLGVLKYTDIKVLILPQEEIKMTGRGSAGQKEMSYPALMDMKTMERLRELINKYHFDYGIRARPVYCNIDVASGIYLQKMEYTKKAVDVIAFMKKNGNYRIINRQHMVQTALNEGTLVIDKSNLELIKFLETVKVNPEAEIKTRIEKGNYEKMADTVNSMEAAIFPYASRLGALEFK